ncbi:hypothetical protein JCM10512_3306 [Bacteroides reticulotermitis JCM 10512]|uniref:Uncharacterized protein n=1 Tax=Bacteroides reticulotermitis JCM 10512 TaxID=1445607 RepID=W4UVU7_9BACE|nr:hypothetical protein JCM10512_3306 [Bacteroides reticulotermitis JCM 10512]
MSWEILDRLYQSLPGSYSMILKDIPNLPSRVMNIVMQNIKIDCNDFFKVGV